MLSPEYHRMREYEDHYWWYHGLRTLTAMMISRYCSNPRPLILDAGCGTGGQSRVAAPEQPFGPADSL